ncbi:MAG: hypothetical protein L6Q99_18555 [Planctomycetes bacterium]|nr:hypothetical protein [Planctomycetota bacterium]
MTSACSSDAAAEFAVAGATSDERVELESQGSHATGISYRYPSDWQLDPRSGGVLIPNDAPRDARGANELYLVLGVARDQAVRADDAGELATILFGAGHSFEHDGAVQELEPGLLFRYRSSGPDGELAAHAYVRVEDGLAQCLVGIGLRDVIEARASIARAVFESFEYAAPRRDPRLVGSWSHGESYTNSLADFSMAVEWSMQLLADGTFVKGSTAAGGDASVGASSDGDATYGTWQADDETLTLLCADGSAQTLAYRMVDGALVTYDEHGRRTIWE